MRPLTLLGTLLILAAFAMMGLFIVLPAVLPLESTPFLKNTLQVLLCKPGDNLTATSSEYDTPNSSTRSTDFSCENSDHQQPYDVSGKAILIGLVGYLVPFMIGLVMVIVGSGQERLRRIQSRSSAMYMPGFANRQGMSFNAQGFDVTVDPNGEVIVKSPDGQVYNQHEGMTVLKQGMGANHLPLAQRLSELKAAFDAGLITQDEYDAKRKDLLNQM